MNGLLILITLFTTNLFAQSRPIEISYQDNGPSIEHPTCRLRIYEKYDHLLKSRYNSYLSFKELKQKGYRVINDHLGDFGLMRVNDLELRFWSEFPNSQGVDEHRTFLLNHNSSKPYEYFTAFLKQKIKDDQMILSANDFSEHMKTLPRIDIIEGGTYTLRAFSFLPKCIATKNGSKLTSGEYDPKVRAFEIKSCYGKKNIYGTRHKDLNNFIEAVSHCEMQKTIHENFSCREISVDLSMTSTWLDDQMSPKGYKVVEKYLERMSFSDLSRKVGDFISQEKICSNSETKPRSVKKLLEAAAKTF